MFPEIRCAQPSIVAGDESEFISRVIVILSRSVFSFCENLSGSMLRIENAGFQAPLSVTGMISESSRKARVF